MDLGQAQTRLQGGGGGLEMRGHAAAGAAPGRPEIHQHRQLALRHMALEAGAVERERLAGEQGLVAATAGRRRAEPFARHAVERGAAGAGHQQRVVGGSIHARVPAGDERGTAQANPRRANRR